MNIVPPVSKTPEQKRKRRNIEVSASVAAGLILIILLLNFQAFGNNNLSVLDVRLLGNLTGRIEGRYFAMGDHRNVSWDSRYFGFVPKENVIGRPLFIYWSFVTPGDEWQKTDMFDKLRFIGHEALHFFTETRWNRTLRRVH